MINTKRVKRNTVRKQIGPALQANISASGIDVIMAPDIITTVIMSFPIDSIIRRSTQLKSRSLRMFRASTVPPFREL